MNPWSPHPRSRLHLHPVTLVVMLVMAALVAWFLLQTPKPAVSPPTTPETTHTVPPPGTNDVVLTVTERLVPGAQETAYLYLRHPEATNVVMAGEFDGWLERRPLKQIAPGLWAANVASWKLPDGRYEFKFLFNDEWESGANRLLHVNEAGNIKRPPDIITRSVIEAPQRIRLTLKRVPDPLPKVRILSVPDLGEIEVSWNRPEGLPKENGFVILSGDVEFIFDPASYGTPPAAIRSVNVAGNFNGWNSGDAAYALRRAADGTWRYRESLASILAKATASPVMFKFVLNGSTWMEPPEKAVHVASEPGTQHRNLSLPGEGGLHPEIIAHTERPVDLSQPPVLIVKGLVEEDIKLRPTPGDYLGRMVSDLPLGAILDKKAKTTTFRLFAPRATKVELGLFETPVAQEGTPPELTVHNPTTLLGMRSVGNGVWESVFPRLLTGTYYAYRVHGPTGDGEGFNPRIWIGDPYATAMAQAEGNSIVVDLDAENPWFQQWTPRRAYTLPEWQDMIIYETHVRNLTIDPSSGVPEALRGKYLGVLETKGKGTGLDHLKAMGVNVIQFMPLQEFTNSLTNNYDWGYGPSFYFAPEASYATEPMNGSQVHQIRAMVDALHREGFAVFVDVVYNHVGGVNVFNLIDRKYYFRLNPDLTNQNFSGCGNDLRSESEMMRRLIVDSVRHWVEVYGFDGFRFDLAELVDMETLKLVEADIRSTHPHVVLISEPWSFRGTHKHKLKGTGWSAWNDDFRNSAKHFMVGKGDKQRLMQGIEGSIQRWTAHPLQSVNYLESHDDHALVDELSDQPGMDGRNLTERDLRIHKLGATLIFTSLGMPMVGEGQMFLRSKHGVRNTYNRGDELNAMRWNQRERPVAREVLAYYRQIIALRQSKEGKAFRVSNTVAPGYVRFVDDPRETMLAYLVNPERTEPAPAFLVLLNADTTPGEVSVALPPGTWRQVGDGERVDVKGLPDVPAFSGGTSRVFSVPAQTALIFRNGFDAP